MKTFICLVGLSMGSVLLSGCGGEPAVDNAPPPTQQEIQDNEEMGKIPGVE